MRTIVCTILCAYLLLLLVTNYSPIRSWLTHSIAQGLGNALHTEVTLGDLQLGLFNRVVISDVRIFDQNSRLMLKADRATAKIELRSLLRSQVALRTVSLLDANIRLGRNHPDSADNFQFVIDALSSKEEKKKSSLNLRINSLILRRVNVSYDRTYEPTTPGRLNPAHIHVSNINANLSLKHLTPDSLSLRVRSFAFTEQSGLALESLNFKFHAGRRSARIENFELTMPGSHIEQGRLTATFDARSGWKNTFTTLRLQGRLDNARISSSDIRPLVTLPEKLNLTARISTDFSVTPTQVRLEHLRIATPDRTLQLASTITLERNASGIEALTADIASLKVENEFLSQAARWFTADSTLTALLRRMGTLSADGNATYRPNSSSKASLNVLTDVARLKAEGTWNGNDLDTRLTLTEARPAALMGNERLPEKLDAQISVGAKMEGKKIAETNLRAELRNLVWNSHTFRPINLTAALTPSTCSLSLNSTDPIADLQLEGKARLAAKKPTALRLHADVRQLQPSIAGFASPFLNASYSGVIDADISSTSMSNPMGKLSVENFSLHNGPHGDYALRSLKIDASPCDDGTVLNLSSDFADAHLRTTLDPQKLKDGLATLAGRALPGLLPPPRQKVTPKAIVDVWFKDPAVVKSLTGTSISLASPLHLHGIVDTGDGRTALTASTDGITIGAQQISDISFFASGEGSKYHALVKAEKKISGSPYHIEADLRTIDSTLVTALSWRGQTQRRREGRIEAATRFAHSESTIDFTTHIRPTQFFLADSVWDVASGTLVHQGKSLALNDVSVSHGTQSLTINGRVSPNPADSIVARLHDIDVAYILGLINFDAVQFGGLATGTAIMSRAGGSLGVHGRLNFPDFRFNNGPMGNTDIAIGFTTADKRITFDADMHLPTGQDKGTKVKGYVSLAEKGLDLSVLANGTNLQFLRRYMNGIFGNFDGEATGAVRIYGPFKKLDFEGNLTAEASARILATGVDYKVSGGTVELIPGAFRFNNFSVADNKGGTGRAYGELRHTHLKNLNYDFSVSAQHLLCYDKEQEPDMPFYSTATGSGNVHLQGRPLFFQADIAFRPESPTTLVYTLGTSEAMSTENSMVRFHSFDPDAPAPTSHTDSLGHHNHEAHTQGTSAENSTTDIRINLNIDANPSAQVKIITDPRAGDNLTVYGEGTINAAYHNKGAFEMFGTYRLNRGTYKLSIQDVIRKDLTIQSGSSITFAGNPMLADLDLKAVYTVNGVSLSDLNYSAGFNQKSVRVDCVLGIGGKAKQPQISFDLDLHNISEDEKQMVRSLISTDEDMNRQIIYLLGIGRFYTTTSGSASAISSQQQSTAAMRSFLSTTITGQLNTAIANVLGSDSHWSFGTNVAAGTYGWNDMEVDGLLQGRLFNDRLLINGNFGYRDRPTYTSNFVGDFDIRYLLTPRGSVSLRAYSETTDRYFTKNSLTTQGIGITLQRDFNRLRELFTTRRRRTNSTNANAADSVKVSQKQ